MRPLKEIEKAKILSTIEPVVSRKEVGGVCVYGSQVAGYAREDSDYDVIIALKPFRQKIKYFYLKGDVECSALVVDSKTFEKDCESSSLGEFVAGRLLNPYESLAGSAFLGKNEIAYKRRVILEGLIDAYAEHGAFASELVFNLPYFLFEKLKKRAAIYPPVVYSYSQTYGENFVESNLESTLPGFRAAAEKLREEKLVEYFMDRIRILQSKFKGGISGRVISTASYTTRSLRQYAVHGYAGRVSPVVVGKEVVSKLSRSRNNSRLPDAIRYPKSFLEIPEGKLFIETENWLSDLLDYFNIDGKKIDILQNPMGEIYTTSSFYILDDGRKKFRIAVKRFKDFKGMKWGILNLWSLKNTDFVVNPLVRMYREYHGLREVRKFGLRTPEVIAAFLSQRILVTTFVQGKDLSILETDFLEGRTEDLGPFEKFGRSLGLLHNNGYCVGDCKPSNVLFADSNSEIYFVDLEQSHSGGSKVWDVAEFVYYSARFTMKEEGARLLVNSFIQGYLKATGDRSTVEKAATFRYRAPFQAFIAPNVLAGITKDLRRGR